MSISQDAAAAAAQPPSRYAPCIVPRLVKRLALFLSLLCLAASAIAATAAAAGTSAPAVTALRCGRLIDVVTGKVLTGAVVLIQGDRITAVGTGVRIPPGAKVIDLRRETVLPGLIDAHTHLLSNYDPRHDDQANDRYFISLEPAQRQAVGAAMAREQLLAGFTTVRDLGNSGGTNDVVLRNAIRDGKVAGPRMVVSTRALAPPGGQVDPPDDKNRAFVEREYAEVSGADEARQAVRRAIVDGADVIKIIVDANSSLSPAEVKAIVDEAHKHRRKVAAHATTAEAVRIAAEAGVDSVEHAYTVTDDVLKLMARKKIFLVPTDHPLDHYLPKPQGDAASWVQERLHDGAVALNVSGNRGRLARAVKLGVPIAAGSDNYYAVPGKTRGQAAADVFRAYADAGLTPLAILQAATLHAAELLGWQDRVGSIARGKYADLIAVAGDPLVDIKALENVGFVMQGGAVVKDVFHEKKGRP
ncbi:MAG TPA: amidohydrolase family protein [Thermoanaerobaculia bacterium]|nr:amidohydrolase family protein [Thermoanaerobaculia bacterium]